MNFRSLLLLPLAATPLQAATYAIDINDADNSVTQPGWLGLDAVRSTGVGSVTADGIEFTTSSTVGARLRGSVASPSPDALFGDFVFEDLANAALILEFGSAGDLAAGEWQVEAFAWDQSFQAVNQIVGFRTNGAETIVTTDAAASSSGPISTFTFTSDGTSAYDVFVRENNPNNRSRLSAVRPTQVPEPSSTALTALAPCGFILRRKR